MKTTRKVISEFGFQNKKSLGQNFLVDEAVLRRIAELAEVGPEELVLEIGPGPGSLTKYLAQKAQKIIAIEKDENLAAALKSQISPEKLELIEADVLEYDFNDFRKLGVKLKVISNLPYNIGTEVVFRLLETPGVFSELFLMLQQEVAKRIVAGPGNREYGILSVICQLHSNPAIVMNLGPEVFRPRPKVNSSLVRFRILDQPRFPVADYLEFKKVVRAFFSMRRKMLKNSFAKSGLLPVEKMEDLLNRAGIDTLARAETVDLERLVRLSNLFVEERRNAGTARG
jgi:16S rRNA (adenine1518-N6/adenine1519-N6)-dimethyltransferase